MRANSGSGGTSTTTDIKTPTKHSGPKADPQLIIISARGLRKADRFGSADPFCVCTVQSQPDMRIQTKIKKLTVEPEWNHSEVIKAYDTGDLYFEVFDWD